MVHGGIQIEKDMQRVLDAFYKLNIPDFADLSVEQARELNLLTPPEVPVAVGQVEDRKIPGAECDIPVRIFLPTRNQGDQLGALVFFHGGGWVIGGLDSHDGLCRRICKEAHIAVIAVDYRRAPETPYPGALNDCCDAISWTANHADSIGVRLDRIGVFGDSSGGNLAACAALRARDNGGPMIVSQTLIYPVISADFTTQSYQQFSEGFITTRRSMEWFWDQYVPNTDRRADPYVSPIRGNLINSPTTLLQTAGLDPLLDEGEAFASKLTAAGCNISYTRYDGVTHGYLGMCEHVQKAEIAFQEIVRFLSSSLGDQ